MTTPDDKTLGVMDDKALSLALLFHETYERLAPNYGYETRIATRKFDPDSPNGQLMIAVCGEIYRERIAALEAVVAAADELNNALIAEQYPRISYLRSEYTAARAALEEPK